MQGRHACTHAWQAGRQAMLNSCQWAPNFAREPRCRGMTLLCSCCAPCLSAARGRWGRLGRRRQRRRGGRGRSPAQAAEARGVHLRSAAAELVRCASPWPIAHPHHPCCAAALVLPLPAIRAASTHPARLQGLGPRSSSSSAAAAARLGSREPECRHARHAVSPHCNRALKQVAGEAVAGVQEGPGAGWKVLSAAQRSAAVAPSPALQTATHPAPLAPPPQKKLLPCSAGSPSLAHC